MIDLNQEELSKKLEIDDKAFLLDVRTQEEYDESHIPNSKLIDINNPKSFLEGIETLNKDLNYYVYCHSGVRSVQACQIMKSFGINNVYNLLGGISEWNGPIVQD
ncbi:MAG: rhodanese-like domain-containing protein [Bacteroidota bacterium]|jgi:rhodanese-related sulfurtransferase|nr:rhodanese-like domain-containing protein [Bacteroidota bacterium]